MPRYTPETKPSRDFDIIGVKLHSGLEITFRPANNGIAIGLNRNGDPICEPTTYPHDRLRHFLRALTVQCRIVEVNADAPGFIIAIELDDDVALAFTRGETGLYASAYMRSESLGHPTFLPLERMRRIIDALGGVTGEADATETGDDVVGETMSAGEADETETGDDVVGETMNMITRKPMMN